MNNMPINFSSDQSNDYFSTLWEGSLSNDDMVAAYADYLELDGPEDCYLEFADLSEADVSNITHLGLKRLSAIIAEYCNRNGIPTAKCAAYMPQEINHSLMELYNYLSHSSPETTRIFTNKKKAISWLLE